MEINLPAGNPTGLSTAILNLKDVDPFTNETFEALLSEDDQVKLTIGFTQDATGKWRSTFFDAGYFESFKSTEPALVKDPSTRLPIQYIVPMVTIKKESKED